MPRDTRHRRFETQWIHAVHGPEPATPALAVPVDPTAALAFDSARRGADRCLAAPQRLTRRVDPDRALDAV